MSRQGSLWWVIGFALFCACGPLDESMEAGPSSEATAQLAVESSCRDEDRCQPPVMVADLTPAPGHTNVLERAEVDGALILGTLDLSSGTNALWKLEELSRGHKAPEWRATQLLSGLTDSPRFFSVVGRKLLFVVDDGVHGSALWMSDGTPAGMRLVKDINPLGDAFGDAFHGLSNPPSSWAGRSTSPPAMALTARSCGAVTARRPAPGW